MSFLYQNATMNSLVEDLLRPKKHSYNEHSLEHMVAVCGLKHHILKPQNINLQELKVSVFHKAGCQPTTCIIFLHGFGSNRLQALTKLHFLKDDMALCCFDFSGCGKSQGQRVTYGQKEKHDIHAVLQALRNHGYNHFVLWGRSMGATTALLYSLQYRAHDVFLLVLDSPFYSFEGVALELVSKKVQIPDFILATAISLTKKNCQKQQYNPFNIELSDTSKCTIPAIFVYSPHDSVVSYQNSQQIIHTYKAQYERLLINENHNARRSPQTLKEIYRFIEKYLRKKNMGRNMQSKEKTKRGIERTPKNTMIERREQHEDYGIWVSVNEESKRTVEGPTESLDSLSHLRVKSADVKIRRGSGRDELSKTRRPQSRQKIQLTRGVSNRVLSNRYYL